MSNRITLNSFSSLTLLSTIPEPVTHIFDTISHQVTRTILDRLGVKDLFGNNVSVGGEHSAPVQLIDQHSNPLMQRLNRAYCSYKSNLDPDSAKWPTAYDRLSQYNHISTMQDMGRTSPLFFDPDTATVLQVNRIPTTLTMGVVLEFKDRTVAYNAFDAAMSVLDINNPGAYFNVAYDYPVPKDVLCVLYRILTMKGLPAASFVDGLKEYSSGLMTIAQNTLTSKREVVVHEIVNDMMAQIDMSQEEPTAVKMSDKAIVYQIEFSVTLQFHRPFTTILLYPLIVKNQLVPSDVLTVRKEDAAVYAAAKSPFINEELYLRMIRGEITTITCVKLPWYDPWRPCDKSPCTVMGYTPIVTVALLLTTDPETGIPTGSTQVDLAALGDITLVEDVIDAITASQGACLYYHGKYNVAVYANEYQIEQESLSLTGTVLTIPHTDLNKVYRLIISVKEDALYANLNSARVIRFDIYTGRGN